MRTLLAMLALIGAFLMITSPARAEEKPVIVLVHGAFAESSSWDGVVAILQAKGYPVISAANPLRSVAGDAEQLGSLIDSIDGPVVLVGHSYGGMVISAAAGRRNVKSLVYVAAFAPEPGESAAILSGKFPGSTLGGALKQVTTPDGTDLYIQGAKFHAQFAADVSARQAALMAVAQRPIAKAALDEPATSAEWKSRPSWWIYGDADQNIPAAAITFMATRANARKVIALKGASHALSVSRPAEVAAIIVEAAAAR